MMDMAMVPVELVDPVTIVCPPDVVQVPPLWLQELFDIFPALQGLLAGVGFF